MMTRKTLSLFTLLFALSAILPAAPALARVSVDTNQKNYAPAVSTWKTSGPTSVYNDGRVKLASTKSSAAYAMIDVTVPSGNAHDTFAFVSFTRAESPRPDLANGVENIDGLPYLYAYFLDKDGKVISYAQGGDMRPSSSDGKNWAVRFGVQDVPFGTRTVRLFLKQASRAGVTPDGRSAWFYDPGVYFVDTSSDAKEIVNAYHRARANVEDAFDGTAMTTSDHSATIGTLTVGTLVKCSGRADVYSVESSTTVKRFPDEETFYAWGHSFADVKNVSCARIDAYRLSGTWTYSRANYLVKFAGQPAVFTLDGGLYLRLIPDGYTAEQMFGRNWTSIIREYPVRDMGNYRYGVPHRSER